MEPLVIRNVYTIQYLTESAAAGRVKPRQFRVVADSVLEALWYYKTMRENWKKDVISVEKTGEVYAKAEKAWRT